MSNQMFIITTKKHCDLISKSCKNCVILTAEEGNLRMAESGKTHIEISLMLH